MAVRVRLRWLTPGPQPNGLQAAPEGLWVIDQVDDAIYLLRYEDGAVLQRIPTRAKHSSGITVDEAGRIWVASTFTYELICYDRETGREVHALPTPEDPTAGAHGLEWRAGTLWVNVPRTATIYQLDPETGRILHRIPAPGRRPHGMAWENGRLWCAETNKRALFLLDPADGRILDALGVPGPEPHGLTIWQGTLWLCDATTRQVFTLERD